MKVQLKKQYNHWTVIDNTEVYDKIGHGFKVKCQCSCGQIVMVNTYNLLNGKTTKCRTCISSSHKGSGNPYFKGYKELPGRLYFRIKRQAKNRQIKFDVSMKFLYEIFQHQMGRCKLTGQKISFEDNTASLDRIKSSDGYTPKNVVWVHKDVNVMKNGYDLGYFVSTCKLVSSLYKNEELVNVNTFKFGTH